MFSVDKLNRIATPYYYYDTQLLRDTLEVIKKECDKHDNFHVHYAVKANANPKILRIISQYGFGADCVSGGEIKAAIEAGFPADKVVYAGVGKSDWEINLGLEKGIACFNVESIAELEVIEELAVAAGKTANVAFRINPNIGAHTHANITTGLAENKFGIAMQDMEKVIERADAMKNINVVGLHFHIGSQILDMGDFEAYATASTSCRISSKSRTYVYRASTWVADSALATTRPTVSLFPTSKTTSAHTPLIYVCAKDSSCTSSWDVLSWLNADRSSLVCSTLSRARTSSSLFSTQA